MGGHHSKQTLSASSDVTTNAVFKQTQDCITATDGINVINVTGDGNVLSGVTQHLSFAMKQDCSSTMNANSTFQTKVQDQITQALKDQDVALTSWLSAGTSTQETHLAKSIQTNYTSDMAQKCLANMVGRNVINVQGSNNVLRDDLQEQSQSMITSCLQGNKQTLGTMTDISDIINQGLSHLDKNPFAFITDALQSIVRNLAIAAVVAIVAVVALVIMKKAFGHKGGRSPPLGPPPDPGAPALSPP